ncbi:hypothetical protein PF005_g9011 [Phytophthora fragariae]|uniref:Uncharacterized protein n=1 Tax=Phytophthora fragariae TaxID=53985 RepID=A0A6A3YCZ7_9STRA|nr:hypothetical protein PF009_g9367 [Phytophthora fragariae]KAE9118006.1 hypothetical protein PF007_g9083 [Phytophthora fragariae]KAE9118616.1 hypothetical protein PF010_g8154 [Phytophthora fragariae]KAE9146981.1 hypothetical protein PF006_g8306 [Phytophthora fragariae]KAE9216540.1 hypothetical protein PF005_g9011 [Phytophthora fragariae]
MAQPSSGALVPATVLVRTPLYFCTLDTTPSGFGLRFLTHIVNDKVLGAECCSASSDT